MAAIKVGAHPMVVAVAMGLLGPGVLLDEDAEELLAPSTEANDAEPELEAPSDAEFARVEDLWHEVRVKI